MGSAGNQIDCRSARQKSWRDPFWRVTYFAALSMLESGGVKPGEVTFIQNGGVGESFAALTGGRVDVCMIGYPFGLRAKNAGFDFLSGRRRPNTDCFPPPPSRRETLG